MRPFEFHKENAGRITNDRLLLNRPQVGLLCSFKDAPDSHLSPFYDFDSLKFTLQDVCSQIGADLHVLGYRLHSHVWMQELMDLVLKSTYIVVDVTDPRPNVIYELGIVCSLRDNESVVITLDERSVLDASEIHQLQLLRYRNKDELRQKLIDLLKRFTNPGKEDEKALLEKVHQKLSVGALLLLKQMLDSHLSRAGRTKGENPWHTHFPVDAEMKEAKTGNWTLFAHELIGQGLARFEYGTTGETGGLEWAIHPTKLGERYLSSEYFLRFFYHGTAISDVQSKL